MAKNGYNIQPKTLESSVKKKVHEKKNPGVNTPGFKLNLTKPNL
jgi:hypothetical protein